MAVYLNANSSSTGQSFGPASGTVVIRLSQATVASDPKVFDAGRSAFIAPIAGVYRLTAGAVFGGGNGSADGVIMGFSVNGQPPFPSGSGKDLDTTNVVVFAPGGFIRPPVAQTLSVLLKLNAGDTVQFALDGIDEAEFAGDYSYLTVTLVS